MLVTCGTCRARYDLADGKIRGTVKAKCRSCGATMVITQGGGGKEAGMFDAVPQSRRGRRPADAPAPREDSSHMFTLAELVGRASSAPPPPDPQARREGSGVIDLNALARAAEERARKAPSEPPPAAFAREARSFSDEAPPQPGR